MKSIIAALTILALTSLASAQQTGVGASGTNSGSEGNIRSKGATGSPGNPAAINAPSEGATSGSGTSTSGGRDNNGDQGRDKMPESNMDVKQQPSKPNIPNPGAK